MTKLSKTFATLIREDARHRATLALAAGGMGTFEWDLATDQVKCDDATLRLFELPAGPTLGTHVFALVHPDDRDRLQADIDAAFQDGEIYDTSFRINRADGSIIWVGARGRVVDRQSDGTPLRILGVNWDMTHAKDHEDQLAHMVREMNHRINNAFALIESMLVLGADYSRDVEGFSDAMCTQIHALADAHQLAADFFLHRSTNTETVPLKTVFEKILRVWLSGPLRDRVDLQIPDGLCILSKDITPLSMILYELATNAAKYSVLGSKSGRLVVQVMCGPGQLARLEWTEILDQPRAQCAATQSEGLGTLLLRHCIEKMSAEALERHLDETGLRFSMRFRIGPKDHKACQAGCDICAF